MMFSRILLGMCCALSCSTALAALKDYGVPVGAMVVDPDWNDPTQKALVAREFDAATVGTFWTRTHPAPNVYDWSLTDAVVATYQPLGQKIQLTPLLWPYDKYTPQWVLDSQPGQAAEILDDHFRTALERYRGVADVWVVVNEAIGTGETDQLRDSWWSRALGEDYVVEAFRLARQYDPDAMLIYNDYGMEYSAARFSAMQGIVESLHAEGLIDGVGWQMHISPFTNVNAMGERMAWVADLGLANFITEMDVNLADGGSFEQQAAKYAEVLDAWLPHAHGGWFQTWGVGDDYSWLGQNARPLLFDGDLSPKPAYDAVDEVLQQYALLPPELPGDTDKDGDIDTADLTVLMQNFTGAVGMEGGKNWWQGDVDLDGDVDTADISLELQNYTGSQAVGAAGAVNTAGATVPEPSGLLLLLLGAGLAAMFAARSACRSRIA